MKGWKTGGILAGGILIGTAGVRLLTSQDAKKAYTHLAAAVLRCKDCIMKQSDILKENYEDIVADAVDINEKRYEAEAEKEIADARAVLERAGAAAEDSEA